MMMASPWRMSFSLGAPRVAPSWRQWCAWLLGGWRSPRQGTRPSPRSSRTSSPSESSSEKAATGYSLFISAY